MTYSLRDYIARIINEGLLDTDKINTSHNLNYFSLEFGWPAEIHLFNFSAICVCLVMSGKFVYIVSH